MVGFLNGAVHEAQHGDTILQQAAAQPLWVATVVLLWSWASLVPVTKGVQNNEAFGELY
jgi:hypothetical protein